MVIWDEPRADVFHRLEVNGIDPAQAQQMYDQARDERIAIIRDDAAKMAALGFGQLLLGVGALVVFSIRLGVIDRPVLVLCALAVVFGTWNLSKGLFNFFFAHTKEGSLADDDE